MEQPSPSPNGNHYQDPRYSVHHRTMSPSSRYRSNTSERYRDVSPKCTPIQSSDNYSYLNSNVHTPIKRYVPTPPPPSDTYSDNGSTTSNYQLNSRQQQQQQQSNNIPYRLRVKCCPNELSSSTDDQRKQSSDSNSRINVTTPVSSISEPINGNIACLYCYRTTGVHQTTQTTGPVSPIPSLSTSTIAGGGNTSPPSPIPSIQQPQQQISPVQSQQVIHEPSAPSNVQQHHQIQTQSSNNSSKSLLMHHNSSSNIINSTISLPRTVEQRLSRKARLKLYLNSELAKFFGVDVLTEDYERNKWTEGQKRLAKRRFGPLKEQIIQPVTAINGDRPDILPPAQTANQSINIDSNSQNNQFIERKPSVPTMLWNGLSYMVQTLRKKSPRKPKQISRSFAPGHVTANEDNSDVCEGLAPLQDDEVFFDSATKTNHQIIEHTRQIYMGERVHGWRTRSVEPQIPTQRQGYRGTRILSHLLDGVLDNSSRFVRHPKLLRTNELDSRNDYRPFFTYWINTVQTFVLIISLICYGIGPIGIGIENKSSQVLVTSLSLQQVHHQEPRNIWIGPRNGDLVHLGAKFTACMRRDLKSLDVISKTRRRERETACCIRNDDSGCVQSSQADCSVRGLWPKKSISTWKKWSSGDSGPGGRISGSVCGLDPKYCDAPQYEWPDDITKWPICRKTNAFSQRFRLKDYTAEHMVCEVIGHPCCTGVYGECRIATREYCDFIHGYFHEEASLCSQVSCLNDVCGMFPFLLTDFPDQFYRLFTSLCLHAGVLHLALTFAFQHIFLSDLERLIGPIRTAIVYIGSGVAGNLTTAIFVPQEPEVGPLASIAGVVSSLSVLLTLSHWKHLKRPHIALIKLIIITGSIFGIGTLPWQQNFTGLIVGFLIGTALTLALVPFVSITKYDRKTKVNLIWTCGLLHLAMFAAMFVIFYIFPSTFSTLNIVGLNGYGGIITNGGTASVPGVKEQIVE